MSLLTIDNAALLQNWPLQARSVDLANLLLKNQHSIKQRWSANPTESKIHHLVSEGEYLQIITPYF